MTIPLKKPKAPKFKDIKEFFNALVYKLVVYKKHEDLSRLIDNQEKAMTYKNAYKDIKRVVECLSLDFSDYKFLAELKKYD